MTFPSAETTLTGYPVDQVRLAVVETQQKHLIEDVKELKDVVGGLDSKLDQLILELARKRSTPPGGISLFERKGVKEGATGVIVAVVMAVYQILTAPPQQPHTKQPLPHQE